MDLIRKDQVQRRRAQENAVNASSTNAAMKTSGNVQSFGTNASLKIALTILVAPLISVAPQ